MLDIQIRGGCLLPEARLRLRYAIDRRRTGTVAKALKMYKANILFKRLPERFFAHGAPPFCASVQCKRAAGKAERFF